MQSSQMLLQISGLSGFMRTNRIVEWLRKSAAKVEDWEGTGTRPFRTIRALTLVASINSGCDRLKRS